MPRPMDETWIREKLADRLGPNNTIFLEGDPEGSGVAVSISTFLEMFGGIDVEPNQNAAAARDRIKNADTIKMNLETGQPDPNGEEVSLGYTKYFDKWHGEGRFNA